MLFKDRVVDAEFLNRYKITHADGTNEFVKLQRADSSATVPVVEAGTPLNARTFNNLQTELSQKYMRASKYDSDNDGVIDRANKATLDSKNNNIAETYAQAQSTLSYKGLLPDGDDSSDYWTNIPNGVYYKGENTFVNNFPFTYAVVIKANADQNNHTIKDFVVIARGANGKLAHKRGGAAGASDPWKMIATTDEIITKLGGTFTGSVGVENSGFPSFGATNTISGKTIFLESRNGGQASLGINSDGTFNKYIINSLADGTTVYDGGTFTDRIAVNNPTQPSIIDVQNGGLIMRMATTFEGNAMLQDIRNGAYNNIITVYPDGNVYYHSGVINGDVTITGGEVLNGLLLGGQRIYVNNNTRTSKYFGLGIDNQEGAIPGLMFEDRWVMMFNENGHAYMANPNADGNPLLRNIALYVPGTATQVPTKGIIMNRK